MRVLGGTLMKEGLIPIGKMAAMNRVSVPTLRLYDEKELLKPRYIDPATVIMTSIKTPGWR
jgi:hypothetical protein